jgi:predicted metal-dependent peptidase
MSTQPFKRQNLSSLEDEKENISRLGFMFVTNEPFYSHILSKLNKYVLETDEMSEVTEIHPMNISNVKLMFDYKKWEPLSKIQKLQRFKHEVLHFVFMHPWQDKPENVGLFYTACDVVVNLHCEDSQSLSLKNFSNLASRYNVSIDTQNGWVPCYNSLVDLFRAIPDQIAKKHNGDQKLIDEEFTMWAEKAMKGEIYDEGTEDLNEAIAFFPKDTDGDPNVSGLSQLIQEMKNAGATDEQIQQAIQDALANQSDPWQSVKDGTSETAAEEMIKNTLNEAKSQGTVPGGLEEYVELFLAPAKIDWRKELRAFTKRAGEAQITSTMTRRSKRFGTHPASKITRTQRIAIAVDTSGSMSDEEFKQAISEVRGALQGNAEVILIQADAVVDNVEIYKGKLPELARVTRCGGGGTAFDDPLLYVKTKGRLDKHSEFPKIGNVDGMVYITDGYAPAPELDSYPKCKVLWLTTQRSVDDLRSDGFKGQILELDCSE